MIKYSLFNKYYILLWCVDIFEAASESEIRQHTEDKSYFKKMTNGALKISLILSN